MLVITIELTQSPDPHCVAFWNNSSFLVRLVILFMLQLISVGVPCGEVDPKQHNAKIDCTPIVTREETPRQAASQSKVE